MPRALTSLEAELARRQRLFREASLRFKEDINHIDKYLRLYREGKVSDPLPYLVLIVDEFTRLKNKLPEQMDKFVQVAVAGRSLGFRMILATQKPAGVISDQIDANARFRLCLRVARVEDSVDMIRRPDAARPMPAGRAYMRVENNPKDGFELIQTAWSGAPYTPGAGTGSGLHEIVEVNLDGSRTSLAPTTGSGPATQGMTQLKALIAYLNDTLAREGIKPLPGPWFPPLPELKGGGLEFKLSTLSWRRAPGNRLGSTLVL